MPRWPSLMAVVERTDREVVVLFGVPLDRSRQSLASNVHILCSGGTHGISDGVSGADGGSGMSIRVGRGISRILR